MDAAFAHLEKHKDQFLELLMEYLRIPSVSAQRVHHEDARRAAAFAKTQLEAAGFETTLFEGAGLPTVYGSRLENESLPTLLVYGHYDVQPPEPFELWETQPFEPAIVDGEVRARGCADDKGPSLALVLAARCWVEATGSLPVNLKFILEGEEEVGGQVVEQFLEARKDDLAADALVIADTSGFARGVPALCYGLRGLVAVEIKVNGPSHDLHSGTYGGTVANPATALARLVASLHDDDGRIAVDGFYDGVDEVEEEERDRLDRLPFDKEAYLAETGSPKLFGEKGFTTLERKGARPTCEVNGIFGGYQGEGSKTIVPSSAGCKLTCRLVPSQEPQHVQDALVRHLERACPPGVTLEVTRGPMAPAVYSDPETDWAKRARSALETAFGQAPALTREGGSIPIVNLFAQKLGVQPLLLGTYTPGERAHSPNERYPVEDFYAGIRTGIALFSGQ